MGFNVPLMYEYTSLLSKTSESKACSFGRPLIKADAMQIAIQIYQSLTNISGDATARLDSLLSCRAKEELSRNGWLWPEEYFLKAFHSKLVSIDIRSDESPHAITDLSDPFGVSEQFSQGLRYFDFVMDLGTSEHIHTPLAPFYNAFQLLKLGGRYIMSVPVSGWLGHGLYRFNPHYFSSISLPGIFELERICFLNISRQFSLKELRQNDHIGSPDDRFNMLSWAIYRKTSENLSWNFLKKSAVELCYR